MGRRTILLITAALIAVLGSGMVYLYVRAADERAQQAQEPVEVLVAVAQIEPGETLAQAQAAGKLQLGSVPREQVLDGAMNNVGESGGLVALSRIFPKEQITTSKFGAPGEQDTLAIPDGQFAMSVSLSDTGRVAGFVAPGSEVAIFMNGPVGRNGEDGARLLLPKVQVIAIGQTTLASANAPADGSGNANAEALPRTLITVAVDQDQAQRLMFASRVGELSFALLNEKSEISPGPATTQANLFE